MSARSSSDLTGRARLRDAAMRLFAERGFDATSTRAVAAAAGVSQALVNHHFGSKDGLRAAVDEEVLARLSAAIAAIGDEGESRVEELGRITAEVFGSDPLTRSYLRRILIEGGPVSAALFDRLLEGTRDQLHRLITVHGQRIGANLEWAPFQLLCLILGPLLLEPVMQPGFDQPLFDREVLADRSAANQALLRHGLLGPNP